MHNRPALRSHVLVAAVVALAAVVVAVVWLAGSERRFDATNSVAPRAWVAGVPAGGRLCVGRLWMPAGSDAVRLRMAARAESAARVRFTLDGPEGRRAGVARLASGGPGDVDFGVRPLRRTGRVRVCLTPNADLRGLAGLPDSKVDGLGYNWKTFQADGPSAVERNGKRISDRVAVWFVEPRSRSLAAELPDVVRRAATFRAGFVAGWTYLLILVILVLLWAVALRLLWRKAP
jgi:hypothetical protein